MVGIFLSLYTRVGMAGNAWNAQLGPHSHNNANTCCIGTHVKVNQVIRINFLYFIGNLFEDPFLK